MIGILTPPYIAGLAKYMLVIDRVVIKKILSVCPEITCTQEFKTLMDEFSKIDPGIYKGLIVYRIGADPEPI